MPQLIRFRRRHDSFAISGDGNATLRISCDVESSNAAVVPWISFSVIAEVPPDHPPWTGRLDWFMALAEVPRATAAGVLRAAYQRPLHPADLTELWPDGPVIGGAAG
ncbi:hypothetical protein [Streptomyces olindensis]|uniref:hypothetical protein n=1 Tax=Streptomyces olindensis TaxID=358823 RepID=UPI00340D1152